IARALVTLLTQEMTQRQERRLDVELLDIGEGAFQRLAPVARQFLEIRIVPLDAAHPIDLERIARIDGKIDRQADAQIGAEWGVEGEQNEFRGFSEPHRGIADPIENGLAVFMLADLQEGRVAGGLDEITRRIDLEQARPLAADLAREQEARGKCVP